jgi:hypothetical protein
MGMSVYHPTQRWGPEDFYTGGDKPFASLANIPRQIFEGVQMRNAQQMKEREMKNNEERTRIAEESAKADKENTQRNLDIQERRIGNMEEQFNQEIGLRREELASIEKTRSVERKAMEARIRQMEAAGNLQGHVAYLEAESAVKRQRLNSFIATNDVFTDTALNQTLAKASLQGVDPTVTIEAILKGHENDPSILNEKALSVISPMIADLNRTDDERWMAKHKGVPGTPYRRNDFSMLLKRIDLNKKSTHDLDEKDPAIQAVDLMLENVGPESRRLIRAAANDVLKGRRPNAELYDKETYNRAKSIAGQVGKWLKEKEKEEAYRERKKESGMLPGYSGVKY